MPSNTGEKTAVTANVKIGNPEQVAEELKKRAEAVKEQVKRLEEAKIVKQETMQIEVSI